ncbi:glycosyltransferase family 4 protein [Salinibacter ruber]|uniref:glycosyltransferase family 4 protein n=1 Tax=Salinibacter ruber TaxID=146919 RepID=UPI002167616A|nr:glycosyltransferase family 1 protein [Salinibacter ruber]MCS4054125.1 glycosyltransferase involved in cell wall biosynthesis [Salinibacter ruber]
MRIGILLRDIQDPATGGRFTFQDNIVQGLSAVETDHEVVVFHEGASFESEAAHVSYVSLDPYEPESPWYARLPGGACRFMRGIQKIGRYISGTPESSSPTALGRAARARDVSFLWFATQEHVDTGLPYVATVWDLGHRLIPVFPEVRRTGRTWEAREEHYETVLRKAAYVVTGTETGKEQIQRYYQVDAERIFVNPFPTPSFALEADSVKSVPLDLPDRFLFYPAQFWPHKNHVLILDALAELRARGRELPVVFTGSDKGNQAYVERVARKKGVDDLVIFAGFVSRRALTYLYQHALALVFVTFLGPDNLPPLEAFALGCPVIASDIPGADEQLGDAALRIDPTSGPALADGIERLAERPEERERLIEKGGRRAEEWGPTDYVSRMMKLFSEAEPYRRCWDPEDRYEHP